MACVPVRRGVLWGAAGHLPGGQGAAALGGRACSRGGPRGGTGDTGRHRRALYRPAGQVPHRLRERHRGDGLQYAGVDITVEEFIDNYLPQGNAPYTREDGTLVGADPWKVFLGSPYEESGWGCYAPVITGALEQLLQDRGLEGLSVQELEGESLDKLCREYIDAGTPVLLWATIAMEAPVESTQFFLEDSGQLFTWLYPLHCLLLTGEDKDCYYFNDPLEGKNVAYPKEQVEAAYEGIGMQSVVLEGSVQ